MISTLDERSGRVKRYSYEIEDSDKPDIVSQLKEAITDEAFDDEVTIWLTPDTCGDTVEFDVTISDYLNVGEFIRCNYDKMAPINIGDTTIYLARIDDEEFVTVLDSNGAEINTTLLD